MSQLIKLNDNVAGIAENQWTVVQLPPSLVEARKQAGKVVLFKLTGEKTVSEEQLSGTAIPESGKVIVPLSVFIARKAQLQARINAGEIGVWVDTHEVLNDLAEHQADLNQLPIIAIHVERFADGRIFSLGLLLRTRYGFKNELRAIGDVLRDQLFFLSAPYQGAVDEPRPAFLRYNRVA